MFKSKIQSAVLVACSMLALSALACSDDEPSGDTSSTATATTTTTATGTTSTTSTSDIDSTSSDATTPDQSACQIHCSPGDLDACGVGQKCTPYRCKTSSCCTDATRCTPETGTLQAGQACYRDGVQGVDDCAAGHFCKPTDMSSAGTGPGLCMRLCDADNLDPNQCPNLGVERGHCFAFNSKSMPICIPTCDPLADAATECGGGQGCYFGVDDFFCTDPTITNPPGTQGAGCDTEQGCAIGFACAPATSQPSCTYACGDGPAVCGCCSQYCDTAKNGEDCPLNMKCLDLPGDRPGVENVGVCGTPL